MRGRILVAHNSKAARSILRRRTLAEAPDFIIEEVDTADELVVRVGSGVFDIVICDELLAGSVKQGWIEQIHSQNRASSIGYIFLVSEATSSNRRDELATSGVHAFLDAQCTATDIAAAITSVFDPRNRRQFRRVCIPGSQAHVRSKGIEIRADIVNISVAGMLCDFSFPSLFDPMLLTCDVALRFPAEMDPELIDGIRTRLLRMQVVSRDTSQLPERIRAAWKFVHVPGDIYERLDNALGLADEEAPPESRSLLQ
jgi:DNA-binding NarL/FixJ family response regulator